MLDLDKIRMRAERVLQDAERGYDHLPMRHALADLAHPLIQLLNAMESTRANRWLTLEEVMTRTGWSRKYYDKPLRSLGGLSRLETWARAGTADKAPPGIWLISPVQVPAPKPGHEVPESEAGQEDPVPATPVAPAYAAAPDPEEIARQLVA